MPGFLSGSGELDARLAELCDKSPGACYTAAEIATYCRCSRNTIAHIERQALKKLRWELLRRGLLEDLRHSCPGLSGGSSSKQANAKGGMH